MHTVKEQALLLGARRSLVGILTEGVGAAPAGRAGVVILNSGIVHRVGANRMSVVLARALAAAGHTTLRFDLSGIGDSDPRADGRPQLEAVFADIREALDGLEAARGIRQVVLAGLCSGADQTVAYAPGDPRVVGGVLLDPFVLTGTLRHRLHDRAQHYGRRLFRAESWLNLLRGRTRPWKDVLGREAWARRVPAAGPTPAEIRDYLAAAYRAGFERGVRYLAVLAGERCSYRGQLRDTYPELRFGELLRVERLGRADHTFAAHVERTRLVALAVDFVGSTPFGRRDSAPDAADRRVAP